MTELRRTVGPHPLLAGGSPASSSPRARWALAFALAGGFAALAAWDPVRVPFLTGCLAAAGYLVRRFGLSKALWLLALLILPLRQPLSVDVVGTRTLYFGDLLIWVSLGVTLWEGGGRNVWRTSATFRLGVVLFALSLVGLYTASHLAAGLDSVLRIAAQLGVFVVARHHVRSGRDARTAILAFFCGLVPAILYGFYQSTIPVGAGRLPEWSDAPIAWDPTTGTKHFRVFSTFDQSLRFLPCALDRDGPSPSGSWAFPGAAGRASS